MPQNISFIPVEVASKIKQATEDLLALYRQNQQEQAAEKLEQELEEIRARDALRVAFIGEYSAGKSSIISALTGNQDIQIDSDITTSAAADYTWGGMILTDTPGLNAENPEHDAQAIGAINQSDILVYCITSDLFDPTTLKDFKKWAYDKNYMGKMFFVVNKMSKEDIGDSGYDQKVKTYTETLNRNLTPHSLRELPHCFVDVQDYRKGVRENKPGYIEESHFEEFIERLNRFVQRNGVLAKFDTLLKAIVNSIDEVSGNFVKDRQTEAYLKILKRLENELAQIRSQADKELRVLIRQGLLPITRKGADLAREITEGDGPDFSEADFDELCLNACRGLDAELKPCMEDYDRRLLERTEEINGSDTAEFFYKSASQRTSGTFTPNFFNTAHRSHKIQAEQLRDLIGKMGNFAQKGANSIANASTAAGQFSGTAIKAAEASGSTVHKVVKAIGGKLGVKFKPWQAANITSTIGNVSAKVGQAIPFVSTALEAGMIFKESHDEEKEFERIQTARADFRQAFIDASAELEQAYLEQSKGFLNRYSEQVDRIGQLRQEAIGRKNMHSSFEKNITVMREDLIKLQKSLYQ